MQHCWMSLSRRALGLLCLLGVVVIWVISAETIQFIFRSQAFSAPFFLTFFNTCLFSLYLVGFLFRADWWGEGGPPRCLVWMSRRREAAGTGDESLLSGEAVDNKEHDLDEGEGEAPVERFTVRRVLWVALGFCPLWFGANYLYNLSLTLTSASSATILSSTSSLFTFALGWVVKVEKASLWKMGGILLTLAGVVIVSLTDTTAASSSRENVAGDIIALAGAASYACYAVYLKVRIADERALHMPMFFGFVGAINLILFWPLGFVLHATGLEPFQWPSGPTLGFLFANGIVGTVVSDYLWVLAVLLASPVVATVGLSLTIPLTMLADSLINPTEHFNALYLVGAALTLLGFVFVNTTSAQQLVPRCCTAARGAAPAAPAEG